MTSEEAERAHSFFPPIYGRTLKSVAAIPNLKRICEEHFMCKHCIQVLDLQGNPQLAKDREIMAIPALVSKLLPQLERSSVTYTTRKGCC
jgi:circadian clock protein KaiB